MHKIQAEPFKRMALVDEMMLQKLKEDAITGYNPSLTLSVPDPNFRRILRCRFRAGQTAIRQ